MTYPRSASIFGAVSLAFMLSAASVLALSAQQPESAAVVESTPPRMLLLVRDSQGQNVIGALLLAQARDSDSRILLIPSDALLQSRAPQRLRDFPSQTPNAQAQIALSRAMGLHVDGTLVLDYVALAALIDSVGGVNISQHTMDGMSAVNYAGFISEGEPEQARTSRTLEVLNDFLRRLPARREDVASAVNLLGLSARSTMPTDDVVEALAATSNGLAFGQQIRIVPTNAYGQIQNPHLGGN